jgi:hypothetical protein
MPQRPQFRSLLTHPANFAYFNASAAQESLNCTSFGDSPPQVTFSKCLLHLHPISAWRLSHEIPSPTSYLICTSISPVLQFRQSRIPSHSPLFILPAVTSHSQAPTSSLLLNFLKKFNQKRFAVRPTSRTASFRLSHQVIPSLPLSRTMRDLYGNSPFIRPHRGIELPQGGGGTSLSISHHWFAFASG